MTVTIAPQIDRLLAVSHARSALRSGRLREIRERHGFSQRELARALGVDDSAVSRWEAGDRAPREDVAERLFALLDALEKAD